MPTEYDQDKQAQEYVVIPRLGVVAPIKGIDESRVDYKILTK